MKKIISCIFVLIMILLLTGCGKKEPASVNDSDLSLASDLSAKARAYTDQLFSDMLKEQGISGYDIIRTNYGFITDDPVIFVVGYEYAVDGINHTYGYQLTVNEGLMFDVIEEGPSAAELAMGKPSSDPEN